MTDETPSPAAKRMRRHRKRIGRGRWCLRIDVDPARAGEYFARRGVPDDRLDSREELRRLIEQLVEDRLGSA